MGNEVEQKLCAIVFDEEHTIGKPILEWFADDGHVEILGHKIDKTFESFKSFEEYLKELQLNKYRWEMLKGYLERFREYNFDDPYTFNLLGKILEKVKQLEEVTYGSINSDGVEQHE